jgi:C4-dicarboxylate-specific signal transduction histidine kinase
VRWPWLGYDPLHESVWTERDGEAVSAGQDLPRPRRAGASRRPRARGRQADRLRDLELTESRLFFALEAVQVGIFDWDVAKGRTVYVAPRKQRGRLVYDEMSAAESAEFVLPEDRPRVRRAIERFLAGETETLDVTHRAHSVTWPGRVIHIATHGKVVERARDGRPRRVLGIFRNVTDEVEQESATRRREAAVANATRLASLGELASILGHELNQPLAALTTYVQAAARVVEVGETSRRETVQALRRCVDLAERASEILKRVRRLVRRLPPLEESFDLRDSAAEVVALLEAEARDRLVEVRVRRPRAPVPVRCDRVQVEQALFNLCRNAIEAVGEQSSPRRVVEVSVSSRGPAALVAVDDSGPGVPAAVAKELFEPFVSTKPDGSGLGLSISKSIAEAQGGSLSLARTGPRGAGFVLRLPREKGRARGARA